MTDKAYFSQQIRAHESSIYGLAYSILKNEHDAADAMQDAILKAYGSLHTLKDKSKFKSWMLTIVHNTAIEHLRRLRPTVDIDEQYDINEFLNGAYRIYRSADLHELARRYGVE